MDLAGAALLAGVSGCVVLAVLCLSTSSKPGAGRGRWTLVAGLAITALLGSLVTVVMLVASRHGIRTLDTGSPRPSTALKALAWGLICLAATGAAAMVLAAALFSGRPRLAAAGLAVAAAALFVLSLAAWWWEDVEHAAA